MQVLWQKFGAKPKKYNEVYINEEKTYDLTLLRVDGTSAFAAELGFVDWNAVVANYPGIKEVAQEVVAEKTRLQTQFNEQAKALTTDQEKIELANKLNAQMAKFEQRKYDPINKKIRETILSVAQANKVDSVVNANAMIVGGKDLTKKVITALKVQ